MIKARYQKYELHFKQPAGTSRGVLRKRVVWYLFLEEDSVTGLGECAPLPGLSIEAPEQVEEQLEKLCTNPQTFIDAIELLQDFPSLKFALETALLDLQNGGKRELFPSAFSQGEAGIPINGLIWMGEIDNMQHQIEEKLAAGFRCIKLKIGAKDFEQELSLLQVVRERFSSDGITLRVDANGAFNSNSALEKLKRLSDLQLHSIEQPISAGQWNKMAGLCATTPLPIALDEELIGINKRDQKIQLLDKICPQYLVLKPSLHGGISGCNEWIELANERNVGWWITSYLESNIGLNAIAQWAYTKNSTTYQGLGTGQLFTNNIDSPLEIRGEKLWFNPTEKFEM
ncbi:o-succinylbenzoate synthase [Draconibacterium halophilum]|uniref:o-succinylbenzoate synthase n=1 Tax=Draconibacterium halophilum TaxID=2706887 RepID=A0A6C0RET8_9BACT|nr:o-succinylbenzoate synthase [Draconibacterium halophilum]QIA07581.1 o-succinylbenzoate synthase [Draconibacterium halophilum]